MQAAFKYHETTPLSAEPSSLQVSGVGAFEDQRIRPCEKHIFYYVFFKRQICTV